MERAVNQLYTQIRLRLLELTYPPIKKQSLPVIKDLTGLMDSLMHREFEGIPEAAFSLEKDKLDINKAYKPSVMQGNYLCVCGATIWWSNRLRHLSTRNHAYWMEMSHHEASRDALVRRALKKIEETCPSPSTTTSSKKKATASTAKSRAPRTTGASVAGSSSAKTVSEAADFPLGTILRNISKVLRTDEEDKATSS